MRSVMIVIWMCLLARTPLYAQSQEAKQLLLDVQQLAQLKLMLKQAKTGYTILQKGYQSVKDISKGNFTLHKQFLDGLLEISPTVREYAKINEIISLQLRIVKEYKSAMSEFKSSWHFTPEDIQYFSQVYTNLLSASLEQLDALTIVILPGKLRMSDDERLHVIDQVYEAVAGQYRFLNEFNQSAALLSAQRDNAQREIDLMRKIHGLK